MHPEPHFTQGRFTLRRTRAADVAAVLGYNTRNREHLAPTMPRRHPDFETEAFWVQRIALSEEQLPAGSRRHDARLRS